MTEIFLKIQKFQIRLANQSNRRDGVKCMLERERNWQAVDISLICNNFFCVSDSVITGSQQASEFQTTRKDHEGLIQSKIWHIYSIFRIVGFSSFEEPKVLIENIVVVILWFPIYCLPTQIINASYENQGNLKNLY